MGTIWGVVKVMNNRDCKPFAPNTFWHVYNRGVGKMDIFNEISDYGFFIVRMDENFHPKIALPDVPDGHHPDGAHLGGASMAAEAHTPYIRKTLPPESFSLLAYTLMPNHFHFVVRQNTDLPISKLVLKICGSYSKFYNKKYERVGSLFQDQFKAVLIDNDSYLLWLSAYIHNNPKTAGLVKDLIDYSWSSYLDYAGLRQGTLCDQSLILGMMQNSREAYKKFADGAFEKIKERKDLEHLFLD